jgi:Ion channel
MWLYRRAIGQDGPMNSYPETIPSVAVWVPLIVGAGTTVLTIFIHGAITRLMVLLVLRGAPRGLSANFVTDVLSIASAAMLLLTAHLLEVAVWGAVLLGCGEFRSFGLACYHSAVNYTTLGYGDIVMSARWRLMGPLEALNGMLLIGISTAALFAIIQRVTRVRFPELWHA